MVSSAYTLHARQCEYQVKNYPSWNNWMHYLEVEPDQFAARMLYVHYMCRYENFCFTDQNAEK